MTRVTGIAMALAAAVHAAVIFGVRLTPDEAPVLPAEEPRLEVSLFVPPAPASPAAEVPAAPADEVPPPMTEPESPPEPETKREEATPPEPEPEPVEPDKPPEAPVAAPEPPPVAPEPPKPKPVRAPAPLKPRPEPAPAKPQAKPRPPAVSSAPKAAPKSGSSEGTPGSGSSRPAASVPPGYQSVGTVSYISRGRADYPREALRLKQTGTVTLTLYINEFGRVDNVEVARSSGYPALDAAAAAAERRSRFRPATIGGRPVKSKARVPYTFKL